MLLRSWYVSNREKNLVLPQLDVLCFVDSHGRPAPFGMETEEEWMGQSYNRGVCVCGGRTGGEKGIETVVGM